LVNADKPGTAFFFRAGGVQGIKAASAAAARQEKFTGNTE
jgi:hypothetical protein